MYRPGRQWPNEAVYVLLFSTVMYLKEKLVSSTLPTFHSILCLFGVSWGYSCFCLHFLCFFWRLGEAYGGITCKECIMRSGFPKVPYIQWMRGLYLKMVSEPCTSMRCDCETLTFVTQKWKLFSNGDLFCVLKLRSNVPWKTKEMYLLNDILK